MPEPLIQLTAASVEIAGRRLLDGVSFTASMGQMVAVLGPNGAGKSTLLKLISGIFPQATGKIFVQDYDPRSATPQKISQHLVYCPQQPQSLWNYRIGDLPSLLQPGATSNWFQTLELSELMHKRLGEVSGGEQKAAHLAFSLTALGDPFQKVVLWDEPTNGLDWHRQQIVQKIIQQLTQAGACVCVATHDFSLAYQAHQTAILEEGRLIAWGPPATTLTPEVIRNTWSVDLNLVTRSDR